MQLEFAVLLFEGIDGFEVRLDDGLRLHVRSYRTGTALVISISVVVIIIVAAIIIAACS